MLVHRAFNQRSYHPNPIYSFHMEEKIALLSNICKNVYVRQTTEVCVVKDLSKVLNQSPVCVHFLCLSNHCALYPTPASSIYLFDA